MHQTVEEIFGRTSELVQAAYKKILIPEMVSRINRLIVTLVNSLIIARYVGNSGVAAVTLSSSVVMINMIFSSLLVSGTDVHLIHLKSQGKTKQASRAFAAVLVNTFVCFELIFLCSLFLIRGYFSFYTSDPDLLRNCLLYFYPMAILEPISETGLVLEKGLKTDGKTGFFGTRMIVTNVMNLILNLLNVKVFHGGLFSISMFSYLAGLCGYFWSASYLFRKECSMWPDFSVLRSPAEMKQYIKTQLNLGSAAAISDAASAFVNTIYRKAIMVTGGENGMFLFGVFSHVISIYSTPAAAVQMAQKSLTTLFYADRDTKGADLSLKMGIRMQMVIGIVFLFLLNVFAPLIGRLYLVEDGLQQVLGLYLTLLSARTVCVYIYSGFKSYMISAYQMKAATFFSLLQNLMTVIVSLLCQRIGSFTVFLTSMLVVDALNTVVIACAVFKSRIISEPVGPAEVRSYSYVLAEEALTQISKDIYALFKSIPGLASHAMKASLLTEECNRLILFVNKDGKAPVHVDYRISLDKKECVITMMDSGVIFDPIHRMQEMHLPEEYVYSRKILQAFAPKSTYTRVMELNVSHIVMGIRDIPGEGAEHSEPCALPDGNKKNPAE